MSYKYRIQPDNPYGFWSLDTPSSGTYLDLSPNSNAATIVGTNPDAYNPLTADTGKSIRLDSSTTVYFPAGNFTNSLESRPFSLEAWIVPPVTGTARILSHDTVQDGLYYDNGIIYFVTTYDGPLSFVTSYNTYGLNKVYHVVGVHSDGKNSLYVDGKLVDEVDVAAAGLSYDLATNVARLYSGQSSQKFTLDSVAIYSYALGPRQIHNHYNWGLDVRSVDDIVNSRQGIFWRFSDTEAIASVDFTYNTDEEWLQGVTDGISIRENILWPVFDESELTVEGTWKVGFPIGVVTDVTTIEGSKIEWSHTGNVTIESSIDDEVSWQACVNGQTISGLVDGFITTDKSLVIRVTFPDGEDENTETALSSLAVKIYTDKDIQGSMLSRTVNIFDPVHLGHEYHPILQHDRAGGRIDDGYAIISEDVEEEPQNIGTIEMWIRWTDASEAGFIIDTRDAGDTTKPYVYWNGTVFAVQGINAFYLNNESINPTLVGVEENVWYHLVLELDTEINPEVFITGDYSGFSHPFVQINVLSFYPNRMTASEISSLYKDYFGGVPAGFTDPSTLNFTEHSPPAILYTHEWAITGAGG